MAVFSRRKKAPNRVGRAPWRFVIEGRKLHCHSLPSFISSPFPTFTFLFIPRSGEGERDSVASAGGGMRELFCFFFRAREEERMLIFLFYFSLVAAPLSFFNALVGESSVHFSKRLLSVATRLRISPLPFSPTSPTSRLVRLAAGAGDEEPRNSRVIGLPFKDGEQAQKRKC
mgnify:CR=1 FL=1